MSISSSHLWPTHVSKIKPVDNTPLTPSEFVALTNQVLDTAFPMVVIEGELSELRISKQRWVYLKLKDDESVVDFFGTVYQLKQPLEDGMMVRIIGQPKLSPKWGFSVNIQQISPIGEGSIRRAFELLKAKLEKEGLFAPSNKRPITQIPQTIGLISSEGAAGATDFLSIVQERWAGVNIKFAQVQVQGEAAPKQIVKAIDYFNNLPKLVDVLVLTRGGGSLEDLMAFNTEEVARAVASSKSPIVVGVGHEQDVSLADLAADVRAATPTHAAALVVPDKRAILSSLQVYKSQLSGYVQNQVLGITDKFKAGLTDAMTQCINNLTQQIKGQRRSLQAYDPNAVLRRGYSVLTLGGRVVSSVNSVSTGDTIEAKLSDGKINTEVKDVQKI